MEWPFAPHAVERFGWRVSAFALIVVVVVVVVVAVAAVLVVLVERPQFV